MGAGAIAVSLAATAASTGLSVASSRREKKFLRRQEQRRQAALQFQITEERELAELRESERAAALAGALGATQGTLLASGVVGGATAEILRESSELAAIQDRVRDLMGTQNRIRSLEMGIQQSNLAIEQGQIRFVHETIGNVFEGVAAGTKAGVAEADRRALETT